MLGVITEEEKEQQLSKIQHKYKVGERVVAQGAAGGFFWATITELSSGTWGFMTQAVRPEYYVRADGSNGEVRIPENWLENIEERQEKTDTIKRLREKSNALADEDGDEDIIEALKFQAREIERHMFPDETAKFNQFFGNLNSH